MHFAQFTSNSLGMNVGSDNVKTITTCKPRVFYFPGTPWGGGVPEK